VAARFRSLGDTNGMALTYALTPSMSIHLDATDATHLPLEISEKAAN
jgi:hypothetical protein